MLDTLVLVMLWLGGALMMLGVVVGTFNAYRAVSRPEPDLFAPRRAARRAAEAPLVDTIPTRGRPWEEYEARATIRRLDPDLGELLDLLMPLPPRAAIGPSLSEQVEAAGVMVWPPDRSWIRMETVRK